MFGSKGERLSLQSSGSLLLDSQSEASVLSADVSYWQLSTSPEVTRVVLLLFSTCLSCLADLMAKVNASPKKKVQTKLNTSGQLMAPPTDTSVNAPRKFSGFTGKVPHLNLNECDVISLTMFCFMCLKSNKHEQNICFYSNLFSSSLSSDHCFDHSVNVSIVSVRPHLMLKCIVPTKSITRRN